ncbi:adhesin [Enterobacteriaceae bacterium ML5]|nr:adhesin [Enterobacteriaceae bacterium ML5]
MPAVGAVDISTAISDPEINNIGRKVSINTHETVPSIHVRCVCIDEHDGHDYLYSDSLYDWTSFTVPTELIGARQYGILNDYLSVAVQAAKGWAPYDNKLSPTGTNICGEQNIAKTDGGPVGIELRVRKRFVGEINIPKMLVYLKGTNTRYMDSERKPEVELYISGRVNVPQKCEINEGDVVSLDFGNIGAPMFSQAGAGNKPKMVSPKEKTIGIKCNNIDAQAILNMTLESNSSNGNAIVSDNSDVGFIVADGNKQPVTPNDINSKIKFQLNDNSTANVPIIAWPVSITGNKPTEGKFSAEGYLRVGFD